MCLKPIFLKQQECYVPCGKCPACKMKRVNAWVFRLEQEERRHKSALFVTLTYDDKNIPISKKGFMTLSKNDWQCFIKRLRYVTGDNRGERRVMYYACGEYGPKTVRPHYHAIIFDVFEDQVFKAWGLGGIKCLPVNANTMAYCCKYICKDSKIGKYSWDDREKERAFMSKNIGLNYITGPNGLLQESKNFWYHRDHMESVVVREGGYKSAMPRYYRDRVFTMEERIAINEKNYEKQKIIEETLMLELGGLLEYNNHKKEVLKNAIEKNILKMKQRNKI